MRNYRLFFIIINIVFLNNTMIMSQNATNNLQKYVYYKQRFLSSFIAVGNGQAESIPLLIRMVKPTVNDSDQFSLGDAPINLGWYIASLATEYKNLNDNGQNTELTVKELWYALEAFNRLDFMAEDYLQSIYYNTIFKTKQS